MNVMLIKLLVLCIYVWLFVSTDILFIGV